MSGGIRNLQFDAPVDALNVSLGLHDIAREFLERSSNPWQFPDAVRDLILGPARQAGVRPPVGCSQPLVDAPYLPGDKGILIPLANYTLQPIEELALRVAVTRPVARVESVLRGEIAFTQPTPREVRFSLPLDNNDFVVLRFH